MLRPYLSKADLKEERGDIDITVSELRSALVLVPLHEDLHLRIADLSLKTERFDATIKEYSEVIDLNPSNAVERIYRSQGRSPQQKTYQAPHLSICCRKESEIT